MGDNMGRKLSLVFSFFLIASLLFSSFQIKEAKANPGYEDLQNDYTEVDSQSKLTTATVRVTMTTLERDDWAYLWKDFGASYFGNTLDIAFDVYITDVEAGDADSRPWVKILQGCNFVDEHPDPRFGVWVNQKADTDDVWRLRLDARDGGATISDNDETDLAINTMYYGWLKRRSGTDYTCDLYSSDANRQTESNPVVQTNVEVSGSTGLRYFMVSVGQASSTDGSDHGSGYIENIDLAYTPGGQDLTFSLFENFNTWESMVFNKEVGIPSLFEGFNVWESLASNKEQSFTFFENFNVWSSLIAVTEVVALDLYFTLFEGFNPIALLGTDITTAITLEGVYGLAALAFILAIVGICLAIAFKKK